MNEDYPDHLRMLPFSHIRAEELHWHHLDLRPCAGRFIGRLCHRLPVGHSDKSTRKWPM